MRSRRGFCVILTILKRDFKPRKGARTEDRQRFSANGNSETKSRIDFDVYRHARDRRARSSPISSSKRPDGSARTVRSRRGSKVEHEARTREI